LRDEHVRATSSAVPRSKDSAPISQPAQASHETEPKRPAQIRAPSPGWAEESGRPAQEASANARHKWLNTAINESRNAQPDLSANIAETNAAKGEIKGKSALAADLNNATHSPHPPRQDARPSNAPDQQLTGKAALAADLKEAKETGSALNPNQDHGRDR